MIVFNKNVALEVEVLGNSQKETVLLISGAGATKEFWNDKFCNSLIEEGYQIIRYNHRDVGASTHFPSCNNYLKGPYTLHEMIFDAKAILCALDIKEVHFIGHSMGGAIAQLLAYILVEQTKSLCVISSYPLNEQQMVLPDAEIQKELWEILIQNIPTGNFENDWKGWLKVWKVLNGQRAFDERLAASYTRSLYKNPKDIGIAYNHIAAQACQYDKQLPVALRSIKSKVLILHGENDSLVDIKNSMKLHHYINHSVFKKLSKAGHMIFNENLWEEIGHFWRCFH